MIKHTLSIDDFVTLALAAVMIFIGTVACISISEDRIRDGQQEILEAIEELKQQKVEQIENPNTIEKVIL